MTRRHLFKLIDPAQTICNFTDHQKYNSRLAKFFASEMNAVDLKSALSAATEIDQLKVRPIRSEPLSSVKVSRNESRLNFFPL